MKYLKIIGLYILLCIMGFAIGIVKMDDNTAFGMILFFIAIVSFTSYLIGMINDLFSWKFKCKIIDKKEHRIKDEQWMADHYFLYEKQDVVSNHFEQTNDEINYQTTLNLP